MGGFVHQQGAVVLAAVLVATALLARSMLFIRWAAANRAAFKEAN